MSLTVAAIVNSALSFRIGARPAEYGVADGRVDAGLAARRLFVLACQFSADLVGVGVTGTWAQREDGAGLVQDGQCLLPSGAGRGLLACGREGVAEVAEH